MDGLTPQMRYHIGYKPIGLSVKNSQLKMGLVLKGTRIVIPKSKHNQVLTMIQEGHLGLGKCKLQIKDTVYWLRINVQLEKLVLNCKL